jgi:ABC-type glycerol-3-phosphate transport system substrate-binding protein
VGDVEAQGTTTLQIAWDQLAADNSEAIKKALHEAGLSNDIELDFLAGAWGSGRRSQYQQWLSAGREKPDMLLMDTGWTIPFIARNQVVDLSQRLSEDALETINDQYFQSSVQAAKGSDGNLHAVPVFVGVPTMQYRKDLLRQVGYGKSDFQKWATESTTWQTFAEATKQAMDNSDVEYGFTFQAKAYKGLACCDFNEFMSSWGGAYFGNPEKYLFGPVGDRPVTVDEQQVVDAIKMVRTFIHGSNASDTLNDYAGNISPSAVLQWTEEPSRKPFASGNAVMHRNWPYSINASGAEDQFGQDLGVMPIPYAKTAEEAKYPMTGGPTASLGGWNATVNPNSQKQEAAMEVVNAMMKDSFLLTLFEVVGWLPPKPSLFDTDRAANVPVMGRYLEQIKIAGQNAVPRPVTTVWPPESSKIAQRVNGAFAKDGNPDQAMTRLEQQLQAIEQSG